MTSCRKTRLVDCVVLEKAEKDYVFLLNAKLLRESLTTLLASFLVRLFIKEEKAKLNYFTYFITIYFISSHVLLLQTPYIATLKYNNLNTKVVHN